MLLNNHPHLCYRFMLLTSTLNVYKRKETRINAEGRTNTQKNASKRVETQPANTSNPKPKKQIKTQRTKNNRLQIYKST